MNEADHAGHGIDSEDVDPFDEFNRLQAQNQVLDAYARFAKLRARGPVQKLDLAELMGSAAGAGGTMPEVYAVLSHEAVSQVLRDGAIFSSKGYALTMGTVMGHTILEMDEPEHSRYRGLIQMAFRRGALERWERELVRPVVNRCVEAFVRRGHADLVRELTFPFPVAVIAGMIGLSGKDTVRFHRWAVELISVGFDPERGLAASRKLGELFGEVLAERRREPREDLMTVLARAELDGTRLSDPEIFAFLRLLAPAGAETTYRSLSNLLVGLLTHPEQLEAIREDRSLIPRAIEEGLRWECPLTGIMRTATADIEVLGVKIPAGAMVYVNLGAANHDETRFERPEEFDLFREPKQHLAFALGAHSCLGLHLAQMETRVALEALLDRLPGLRLDPEAEPVVITGLVFRSPASLPVRFDPV